MRERSIRHILIKGQCDLFNQACTSSILGTLACCYYCILFYSGQWGGGNAAGSMRGISGMTRVKKKNLYAEMKTSPCVVAHWRRGPEESPSQEQRAKGDVYGFTPGLFMGAQLFPKHHRPGTAAPTCREDSPLSVSSVRCDGHRRPGQIFIPHCILWLNLVNAPASPFALFTSQALELGKTQHEESELWTPA